MLCLLNHKHTDNNFVVVTGSFIHFKFFDEQFVMKITRNQQTLSFTNYKLLIYQM